MGTWMVYCDFVWPAVCNGSFNGTDHLNFWVSWSTDKNLIKPPNCQLVWRTPLLLSIEYYTWPWKLRVRTSLADFFRCLPLLQLLQARTKKKLCVNGCVNLLMDGKHKLNREHFHMLTIFCQHNVLIRTWHENAKHPEVWQMECSRAVSWRICNHTWLNHIMIAFTYKDTEVIRFSVPETQKNINWYLLVQGSNRTLKTMILT